MSTFGFGNLFRSIFRRHPRPQVRTRQHRRSLELGTLEDRTLLSSSSFHPAYILFDPRGPTSAGQSSPYSTAFTPAGIEQAYAINQAVIGDGTGETIAIIDAYDNPKFISRSTTLALAQDTSFLASDLHQFDVQYNLPEPTGFFTKVNQSGGTTYPATDPAGPGNDNWEAEEALDVEWVHALAPGAHILLVEATDNSANLFSAAAWAGSQSGAQVVSMSWGASEFSGETSYDSSTFVSPASHGVTFVASTGDSGQPGEYPAYSPNVVAVGGTSLYVSGGTYSSESGWSGSGGGISQIESQPAYQSGLTPSSTLRTNPDVSLDADPSTGVSVYDSYNGSSTGGPWYQFGGTSFSAPAWAALVAIADQKRAAAGLGSLDSQHQTLPILYTLPASDFHDVTTGNNGFAAGPGYDLVTGIGTPIASKLVPDLDALRVDASTPGNGSTVATLPTVFTVTFSDPITSGSLQASSLKVDGVAATSVTLDSTSTIATFTYSSSPVTAQGVQSMALAAGAATALANSATTSAAFTTSFYYDPFTLAVASTNPSVGGIFTLPASSFTYNVTFNQPIDPATAGVGNLVLSQGTVTAATVLTGNQTVQYTLTGLTTPGTLTVNIPTGTLKDQYDDPGFAPFSGSYYLDQATTAMPTPLVGVQPFGSLIYDTTASNIILFAGDTDHFTLAADPGQTLTVLVTPTSSGLTPTIQLSDPSNTILGNASASGPGQNALLQPVATTTGGTYTVTVGGVGNTAGNYTVQIYLDAAVEAASVGIGSDNTRATAQNLTPSFVSLQTSLASGSRGAAVGNVGQVAADTRFYSFSLAASQLATVGLRNLSGSGDTLTIQNGTGTTLATGVAGATNLDAVISNFVAPSAGTYYVVVSGSSAATYSLVVTRDATLDTEIHNTIATAENITGTPGVLGAVATAHPIRVAVQLSSASSSAFAATLVNELNSDTEFSFNAVAVSDSQMNTVAQLDNYDVVFLGDYDTPISAATAAALKTWVQTGQGGLVASSWLNFNLDGYSYGARSALAAIVPINVSTAGNWSFSSGITITNSSHSVTQGVSSFSTGTDEGALGGAVSGATILAVDGSGRPAVVVDQPLDGRSVWLSPAYEFGNSALTASSPDRLLEQALAWAAPPVYSVDWYQITLSGGQNVLQIQTQTPLSGPNQAINALSPSIQLYNASSTLVASGTLLADGHNQSLLATGLTAGGTYYVKVTPASNSRGEYFLGVTPQQTPAVTTNPSNQTVSAGQPATFTAAASGTPAPTVQWQVSTNNGVTYTPISGATATTFTIAVTSTSQNGNLYEAVFSNAYGSVTTAAASLTVQTSQTPPAFTSGTPPSSVTAGQTYSFTFTVSGSPTPALSASNLPSWLTFNPATGVLTGSSTTALAYNNLQVLATNAAGSATTTFNVTVNPAAVNQLVFGVQPTNTTAGVALAPAVTVNIEDQFGTLVSSDSSDQVTVSATGPGSFTGSTTTVTASSGVATFSNLHLNTAGSYTLSATATGGLTGPASSSFTITPAAANQLVFSQQPTNTTAGVALAPSVTVKIEDPFGNLVSSDGSDTVTVAATGPGPFTGGSTTTVTASSGVATFSNLHLNTAGSYTLSETSTGALTGPASGSFTVTPAAANQLVFGVQPSNTTAGVALAPSVTVKIEDPFGNLVSSDSSDTVTVSIASGPGTFTGSTTTVTASSGVATFSNLHLNTAGSYTLSATATGGLTGPASGSFTVTPAAANQLVFGVQPSNTTTGSALAPSLTVKIEDSFGNLVSSDSSDAVTIGIATGPGSFTGSTTTVTASSGVATFSNLHLNTAGSYTLSATATGALTGPASSSFTVTPAAANQLVFGVQPSNTTAGAAITPSLTVKIEDPFGNLVSSDSSDTVTVSIASGPGTFTGSTTTVTASSGVATFSNLHLNTAGSYTLSATATSGLTGPASSSFTVTPAAANQLVFGVQPSNTTAGAAITPSLTVTIEDPFGNLVSSDSSDTVTVAATGPGPFTGGSTTTVTASSGVATFSNLHLNTAGSYTLSETATGGLTGPASSSFTVTPAAANQLVFGQQPTNTTAGVALAPSVTVKIEDPFGNVVTGDNSDQVTVSATGPGSFTGSTTTVTASSGVATFSNLHLNTAGSYTLNETATGGLTGPASSSFTVTPAGANQLAFGVQPSSTTAGVALAPWVTVKIEDPFGNLVSSDSSDTVTVSIASGSSSFTGGSTTTVMASSGVATFSNLHLNTAGSYTLNETASGGLSGPASSSFTVTPAAANQLVFGVQPSNTTAGAALAPSVTVKIEDPFGNLVSSDSSDTVTIGVASGPGTFAGTSTLTVTASSGVATFSNLHLNTAGSYSLSETAAGGLTGPASSSFTVTPAGANQLAFGVQPSSTTAGVALAPWVTVKIEDPFGNLVSSDSSDTVTVSIASGSGSFTGGSTTTVMASSGVATFSNLHLNTAGSYTLNETASGGLSGPASSSFTVTPAAANQLVFGVQPSNTTAGAALAPSVTVKIEDPFGNLVSNDSSDTVTIGVASGPGTFAGTSTLTVTASSGVATFSNLHLNTAGSYSLSETAAGGLTGPASSSFTVTPAAANQLAFGVQPSSTTAGVALAPPVTVKIEDPFGNLVSSDGSDQVTIGVASGPGTFAGTSTLTATANSGVATFSNLHLNTAGSYSLSETATGGLTGPASGSFTVTPAAANQLVFGVQPSNTTAGAAITPSVTVTIEDPFGNLVSSDNSDTVTVSIASGSSSFTGGSTTTVPAGSGVATFSNLHLNTAGSYTLREAATGGLTGPASSSFTVTPAAANQLVFGVEPSNTTAGAALAPSVTVKIEDLFGNLVSSDSSDTVTVSIASGSGSFTGGSTTTVTASSGVATFSNLHLNTAGSYTLNETASGGLSGPASSSFTVTPAAANQLVFGVQPSNTTAGAALAPSVTVKIEDPFGNLVSSDSSDQVTVSIASGPGSFTSSTTTVTASSGVATFSNLHLNTAGSYTLNETASGGLSGPASSSFTVTPAAANQLVFGVQPSNTTAGAALAPSVTVKIEDPFGNLVSSDSSDQVTVSIASGPGSFTSSTTTVTASSGVATFSNLHLNTAGSYTLNETASGGLSGPASSSFTVTPAAANQLVFGVQPSNTTAGAALAPSVTVKIEDPFGNLVSSDGSDTVTIGVASGPGTFAGTSTLTVTANSGVATFNNLHLNTAGSYSLSATATGGLTGPASSSFTVTPAGANQLAFGVQPSSTTAGVALAPWVTVKIEDPFGNLVSSDSSDTVTIGVASGPGTFAGTSTLTVTASSGVATFSNLHLNTAGSYTLSATATGALTGPASSSFTVTPAAANQLVFGQQPTNTTAGVALAPSVTVTIEDPFGNLVSSDNSDTVTVSIASGSGSFTGGSTTTVTVNSGVATFSNLHLNTAGSYTLSATATGGLTGPASSSFTVTPAAANQLVFGQQPTNTTAGVALAPSLTVKIEDPFGNLVSSDSSDTVTVAATGPGPFTGGSTTTVTASSGVATFSNLHLNTAGSYTLSATSTGGLTGPASSSFTVTPAAANQLVFGVQPSNTTAGAALAPSVTVKIEDPFGNLVSSDSSDQVTVSASGPGSFTGSTTTVTASSGVATFSNLHLNTAGSYTLSATATGALTGPASSSFTVTPAGANQLVFGVQPSNTTAGSALAPSLTVTIEDPFGNLVSSDSSDTVTVSIASGSGSFTGGSTTTVPAGSGVATFSNLHLNTAGSYTLSETATGGLTGPASSSFTVTPAAANQLVFGQQPTNTTAGVALAPSVTVTIEDPFGNLVSSDSSDTVTIGVASGPGTFAGTSTLTVTASSGVATFSNLHLNTAGSYTLSATATGALTGPASSSFTVTPAAANQLVFGQQPTNTTAGVALAPSLTVTIEDPFGNLVSSDSSDTVTIGVASGPGTFAGTSTLTVTASSGVATFSNLHLNTAGSYTLSATATGALTGPASSSFTVTPAAANQLVFGQQPTNTTAGVALAPSLTVKIEDPFGNLVSSDSSDTVTVAATGPGPFTGGSTTTVTASSGVATFSNLHLNTAGSYSLSETATGGLTGPASSSFTVTPAGANQLAFGVQPSSTTAGVALAPSVTVKIEDPFGNLVSSDSSDQVTVSIASGPGSFTSSTTTVTASSGVATFSNLHLNTAGSYTLNETASGGLSGPASSSFTVTPAAANQLVFGVEPSNTTAGAALAPSVTVKIEDLFGNLVSSDGSDTVTIGVASGPGTFAGTSTLTATANSGVATFNNLHLNTAGSYSLSATATGGLTGPASSSFTVTPAGANQLVFGVQPSNTTAGSALAPSLTVKIEDPFGNLVSSDSSDTVTIGVASGPGTFAGTSTLTVTASSGVATFSNLHLNTAGSYTLNETATGGLTGPASSSFTVTPAGANQLAFGVQPSSTTAGVALAPSVTVKIEDPFGNLVSNDSSDTVTVAAAGPGSFAGGSTTTVTASSGVATFSNLHLNTAGSYSLSETATGGLTGPASSSFTVTPAGANQLAFGVQPSSTTAGVALAPSVTVKIEDPFGNLVSSDSSDTVTVSIASGSGSFTGGSTTTATANSGVATFNNLHLNTAGSYTLSETATGGLTGPASGSFTVTPAAANQLVFGVQPSNTTAGAAITPSLTVTIEDPFGNLVSSDSSDTVTVAAAGPGTFTGGSTTTLTASSGVATFSNLHLNTAGSYTLSETATGGLTGPASSSFTVTPAAANQLVFGQQPTNTTAGSALAPSVTVTIEDPFGNLVSSDNSDTVTVSIASGSGSFTGGSTTTVTASSGVATFSNLHLNTAGSYTLSETATGGLTGPASGSFTVTPAAANQLVFGVQPSNTTAGAAITPSLTVTIEDPFGNLVSSDSSDTVTVAAAGPGTFTGGSTTTLTASSGVATFSNLHLNTAGSYTLSETSTGGLTGPASSSFTVTPAAANQLVFGQQPTNTTAGVALAPSLTVKIEDPFGNLVSSDSSDTVTVAATGPGPFTGGSTTTVTASSGVATFSNLHLNTAGSYTLSETATGGLTGPASGSFTVTPAAANQLVFGVQPSNTTAGSALAPSLTVKIEDPFGNLVSSDSSDTVTVSIASGPGTFAGTSTLTVTASSGVATFSNLHLNTAGSYTLSETATGGLTGPASGSFTVTPAAANQLVFGVQPSNTTAGAAITPSVTVKIEDPFGNLVSNDSSDTVTVAAAGPGSFAGGSTTTVTASSGVATFSNLHLNTAGSYSLNETAAGGLTGPASSSFTVTPAGANQLVFGVQPSNTTAGSALAPSVTVKIEDPFGNLVSSDSSDTVTVSIASGPGTFAGTSTLTATVNSGVATFSNLHLNTAGSYTLSATATGGLTGPASSSFTVTPAAANQLVFGQQPTNTTAGVALAPSVTVKIEDPFGNVVTGDNSDQVTVSATGPGSFTGSTTTVTASSGVATFSNLHLNTAGSYSLSETATSGLTGPASSSFTVTPAAANQLVFGVQPSNTTAGSALAPSVTVKIEDPFGNLVSSDSSDAVTVSIASGLGSFTGSTTTVPASSGVATFSNLHLNTAGSYTLSATATGGLTGPASGSFTVTPAAANQLVFGVQPSNTMAGSALAPSVTVKIEDPFGNLVSSDSSDAVTVSIASGPGSFTGSTTTVTASSGVATFSNLHLNTAGSYTLSATATGGLTGPASGSFTVTPAAANQLVFGVQPSNTTAGAAITPSLTVTIEDPFGNLVSSDSSDTVTVAATGPGTFTGGSTTTLTASSGVATFSNLHLNTAGSYTLSETATGGLTGPASSSFTVTPAAANQLVFGQQPTNTTAGSALAPSVTVTIEDPFGNLVSSDSSDTVTVSIASGPGTFAGTGTLTVTASGGVATFSNLVINTAGSYTLGETASGGLSGPASSSFTVIPAAANQLVFGQQPNNTAAGAAIAPSVTVQIEDPFGNVVISDNTDTVTIDIASGPGTFTGTSTVTATSNTGVATFTNLRLNTAGTYTLSETASSLTGPASNSFTVTPTAVIQVAFGQPPTNTTAGTTIAPAVTVKLEDQFGNVVTTDNTDTVTLGITSGPGSFSGSTTTLTASAGIATFSNLRLNTAGSYTLSETASSNLTGPNSSSFTITPAAPNQLAFGQQPTNTASGNRIAPAVTVKIEDQFGNLVSSDSTDTVTVGIATGPGTATIISGTGGAKESGNTVTLTTTAGTGYTTGQTVVIAGVSVSGYNGTFIITSVPTGTTFTYTDPTSGLAKSGGGTATVTPTFNGGSTTSVTASAGLATFSNLVLGSAGSYTLSASATGGLTGPTSKAFNVTLVVVSGGFVATPTGFTVTFSQAFNPATINLTGPTGTDGPVAVTLVGNGSIGPVSGSLYLDPTDTQLTFVKTVVVGANGLPVITGSLPLGTYTVTLVSGSAALTTTNGQTLDGNSDGVAGDNYTTTFHVVNSSPAPGDVLLPSTTVLATAPDFARGPQSSSVTIAGINGATESGNTVTITTTLAHAFSVGQTVTIAGVGMSGYDGTFTITSVPSSPAINSSSTTFTYTDLAITNAAASGGGTANVPAVNVANNSGNGIPIDLTALAPVQTVTFSSAITTGTIGTFRLGFNSQTTANLTVGTTIKAPTTSASTSGASESGTTVTIRTATATGLKAGESVTINGATVAGYNGTFTVASTPTTTSFTYTDSTSGLGLSGNGTWNLNGGASLATAMQDGLGELSVVGGTANVAVAEVGSTNAYTVTFAAAAGNPNLMTLAANAIASAPMITIVNPNAPAIVTDTTLVLSYNANLLAITGATVNPALAGATFTVSTSGSGTAAQATITFHSSGGVNLGALGSVDLGGLVASVPSTAAYKSKMLLHFVSESLNGGALTAAGVDGYQLVAYQGDTDGNGSFSGNDQTLLNAVAGGSSPGFAAYRQVDPVIIGSLSSGSSLSATDSGLLASYLNGVAVPQVPDQTGVTPTLFAPGPDPSVSIPSGLVVGADGTVVVPVNLDDARPAGSTGLTQAELALTYDPSVFTVSPADVQLGTIPSSGSGWTLSTVVDARTGQIAITLLSQTPIATSLAGSLVTIDFHRTGTALSGTTSINLAAAVDPNGQGTLVTALFDTDNRFILSTVPTNGSAAGVSGSVWLSSPSEVQASPDGGAASAMVDAASVSAGVASRLAEALPGVASAVVVEASSLEAGGTQSGPNQLADQEAAEAGAVGDGASVHAGVGAVALTASRLAATPAQQAAGLVFQFGNTPPLSMAGAQHLADQWFLALGRGMGDLAARALLMSTLEETSSWVAPGVHGWAPAVADEVDGQIWERAGSDLDWLPAATAGPLGRRTPSANRPWRVMVPAVAMERAALDQYFADMADDTTDPSMDSDE